MDYVPHLPRVLIVTMVAAVIAAISELAIVFNINKGASCGNEDEDCKHLSPPLKMILAAIAATLYAAVTYMTYVRYRVKTTVNNDEKESKNKNANTEDNNNSPPV